MARRGLFYLNVNCNFGRRTLHRVLPNCPQREFLTDMVESGASRSADVTKEGLGSSGRIQIESDGENVSD